MPAVANPETPKAMVTLAGIEIVKSTPISPVPTTPDNMVALAPPLTKGTPKNPDADTPVTSTLYTTLVDAVPIEPAALTPSTDTSITGDP